MGTEALKGLFHMIQRLKAGDTDFGSYSKELSISLLGRQSVDIQRVSNWDLEDW